jgi:hypothetical protein
MTKFTPKMKKAAVLTSIALAGSVAVAAGTVTGTTEAAFTSILDELKGWLVGAPGKIIATVAFGAAMFNVVRQNFVAAIGAFLGAMLMAFAGPVIDTIFAAGI